MNRQQKIALFQLALVGIIVVASVILTVVFVRKYEYGFLEAWWFGIGYSTPPFFILAVLAPPIILRKKKRPIDFDERDLMIDRRAMRITFAITYAFFIVACMTTWVVVGFDSLIPAYWLTRIVLGGGVTSIVAHALTTLVCYHLGGKDGQ